MTHTDRHCCDGRCEQGRTCPARPVQDFERGTLRRVHDPESIVDPWFVFFITAVICAAFSVIVWLWVW